MSEPLTTNHTNSWTNVASFLSHHAAAAPDRTAVVVPLGYQAGRRQYRSITFRELDQDSDRIARGLREHGVQPGTRLALLVRPSIEFVALVFGLMKGGVTSILIDPGMGRRNLIDCLSAAEPAGFVALPMVHAVRVVMRHRFPRAKFNVTVGRRWFWGGITLDQLRGGAWTATPIASTKLDDPAAIIFTTGSTGPPKGVLYRHGNFVNQVTELQTRFAIEPGGVDLACFPLFGLFNAAMGMTTVIPEMDASRPAQADPAKIVEAIQDWQVTQSFASPAIWNRVGPYCRARNIRLKSLRRVFSAGAPIPPSVLETMQSVIADEGEMYTPYGATESLPVATISAREVLSETRDAWARGAGTCVGSKFPGIEWRVIRVVDGPIKSLAETIELPRGEVGELIVRGPVVTREYVTRIESNATGKIVAGDQVWHRMGDVGYLDERDRFWFCGRMAHRVETAAGPLYTDPIEGIFNQHPQVFRSALVGIGPRGQQTPVVIVEPHAGQAPPALDDLRTLAQQHAATRMIERYMIHKSFPVDIRHNAKIFREKLAKWVEEMER
jgi:acyl-CoA synthetase (AMP-forming)/AMP-acid ligase II